MTPFYAFPHMHTFSALHTSPHLHLATRSFRFIVTFTGRFATYVIPPTNPSYAYLPNQPISTLFSSYETILRFATDHVQHSALYCTVPNSWSDLHTCTFKSSSFVLPISIGSPILSTYLLPLQFVWVTLRKGGVETWPDYHTVLIFQFTLPLYLAAMLVIIFV